MSIESLEIPVRPVYQMSVRGSLFVCDPRGNIKDDITDYLESMVVTYDYNAAVKGSLEVSFRRNRRVQEITDQLMPWLTVSWIGADGLRKEVNRPLGVFYYLPPDRRSTAFYTIDKVHGLDTVWRLANLTNPVVQVIPVGRDHGEAAYVLLNGESDIITNLPRTYTYVNERITVRRNEYLLPWANNMYYAAGYWDIATTMWGKAVSSRIEPLSSASPKRIIDAELGDLIDAPIDEMPDRERFANLVVISSNSPSDDQRMRDGVRIENNNPNDPYSTVNAPIRPVVINDSRAESFEIMTRQGQQLLERSSGVNRRHSLMVHPDPRMDPREVWQFRNIRQIDGTTLIDGNYYVERSRWAMTPEDGAQSVTVSSVPDPAYIAVDSL